MTTTTSPAPAIEDLFHQGHPLEHVVAVGLDEGWTRDDVLGVLRDRQWDLDASGRLPRSKRVTTPRGLRDLPAASMKAAPAPKPAPTPADVDVDVVPDPDPSPADDATPPRSSYIAVLKASELGVDHDYQRPLDEPRVKRMAASWDPRMLGVLDVSDRGPGHLPRYAVINGQHRAAAAAHVSPDGADVPLACTVHEGLTVADEAALMHELDRTTKKLSGWDRWRARRGAGDPAVLTVDRIAAQHGLRVDDAPVDGTLRSYGTAEKLLNLGGDRLLDSALAVLRAAYGDVAAAYQAPLLMGVGQLIHRTGDTLDMDRLRRALVATRPEQLRSTATALREVDGGSLHELMTRAIAGAYNRTPGAGPRIDGGR